MNRLLQLSTALTLSALTSVAFNPAFAYKEGVKKCTKTVCSWEKAPGCHAPRCAVHKVCKKIRVDCRDM
jgi:hypothetical protein